MGSLNMLGQKSGSGGSKELPGIPNRSGSNVRNQDPDDLAGSFNQYKHKRNASGNYRNQMGASLNNNQYGTSNMTPSKMGQGSGKNSSIMSPQGALNSLQGLHSINLN